MSECGQAKLVVAIQELATPELERQQMPNLKQVTSDPLRGLNPLAAQVALEPAAIEPAAFQRDLVEQQLSYGLQTLVGCQPSCVVAGKTLLVATPTDRLRQQTRCRLAQQQLRPAIANFSRRTRARSKIPRCDGRETGRRDSRENAMLSASSLCRTSGNPA